MLEIDTTTDFLRPYQRDSVMAVLAALEQGQHPVVGLPTGSGKSRIVTALCTILPGRILVATHRKELLEQNEATSLGFDEDMDTGIVSAGLGRREYQQRIIFGGIQSIYRSMAKLLAHGPFAAIIVDEAHCVPLRTNPTSMYSRVFDACPATPRIGLSATPYRLDGGPIYGTPDTWFTHLVTYVGIRDLTPPHADYLAPLKGVLTAHDIDTSGVRVREGDYVVSDLSQAASDMTLVTGAIREICQLAAKRRKWLVFCVDVAHTHLICATLNAAGIPSKLVTGKTPADERKAIIEGFRRGEFRSLVNCLVLTTGFDVQDIDCIVLLRPSKSKGLVVQMLGRGTRKAPNKVDCIAEGELVLTDHGLIPIEKVACCMKLWNGIEWVSHAGIIEKGYREVITYAGLTATPDHRVLTPRGWRTFGECAAQNLHLIQTGLGRTAVRTSPYSVTNYTADAQSARQETDTTTRTSLRRMHRMWTAGMDIIFQPSTWENRRLSPLWTAAPSPTMALQTPDECLSTVYESQQYPLERLWRTWHRISLLVRPRRMPVDQNPSWPLSWQADRSYRQQRALRSRQSAMVNPGPESRPYAQTTPDADGALYPAEVSSCAICGQHTEEFVIPRIHYPRNPRPLGTTVIQTQRRVWDIRNTGPLHCFTVSGVLVHNCVVLDFAGVLTEHKPLDEIPDLYVSPERQVKDAAARAAAAKAEAERKARLLKHGVRASLENPMDGDGASSTPRPVYQMEYGLQPSKTFPGKTNLRVTYTLGGDVKRVTIWLTVEYDSRGARFYAEQWFRRRGVAMPPTARLAWEQHQRWRQPHHVVIKKDGEFWRVVIEQFDTMEDG